MNGALGKVCIILFAVKRKRGGIAFAKVFSCSWRHGNSENTIIGFGYANYYASKN